MKLPMPLVVSVLVLVNALMVCSCTKKSEMTQQEIAAYRDAENATRHAAVWRYEDADGICYGYNDQISCIPKPPKGAP